MKALASILIALGAAVALSAQPLNFVFESEIDTQAEANAIRTDLSGTFAADSNGDQANATVLTDGLAWITSGGAGYAIKLPSGQSEGYIVRAYNTSSQDVLLFPETGGYLGSEAQNASLTVPAGSYFVATRTPTAATWSVVIANDETKTSVRSSTGTLTRSEQFGRLIYVTGTSTLTLQPGEDGMGFVVKVKGAITATLDPNGSEVISLDGTDLAGGVSIVSDGTTGAMVWFVWVDALSLWEVTAVKFSEGS